MAEDIHVYCESDPKPASVKKLRQIYDALNQNWAPHHKRKLEPRDRNKNQQSSGEHEEPDLLLANLRFKDAEAAFQQRHWADAASHSRSAEHLFSSARLVTGVIQCRLQLCNIFSSSGWQEQHLPWLLDTLKLVFDKGTSNQIFECLFLLAYQLPDSLADAATSKFIHDFQQLFKPGGEVFTTSYSPSKCDGKLIYLFKAIGTPKRTPKS